MDAAEDRSTEDLRVAEIRGEIVAIRLRIAEAIDALEYKADVPARLADVLSATASTVTSRCSSVRPRSAGDLPDEHA